MKQIQIAIDGPASSGKSTVAKIIAKDLGYTYLDTGAMYRAATYLALQNNLTAEQVDDLLALLDQYPISFGRSEEADSSLVFVADVDVTHPIRDNQVTDNLSWVCSSWRQSVKRLVAPRSDRNSSPEGGIVIDGRGIWDGRPYHTQS